MTLIWLCVVLVIVGVVLLRYSKRVPADKTQHMQVGGVVLIIAAVIAFIASCVRIVPPGSVGVQVLFGSVRPEALPEGIHLINPFVELELMSIRTEAYTMSAKRWEGAVRGDDALVALSSDGLSIRLDVTILYRLDPQKAPEVYRTLGPEYVTKIVRPAARTAIRDETALYAATKIYSEERQKLADTIEAKLKPALKERGIICEEVLLRNVELPRRMQDAINEKLAAEQEAQKMQFLIQKEELEAKRKKVEADGIASANHIIGESLTSEYLQWYYIKTLEQLVDAPNNTVIVLPFDQKLTPLLNIPSPRGK